MGHIFASLGLQHLLSPFQSISERVDFGKPLSLWVCVFCTQKVKSLYRIIIFCSFESNILYLRLTKKNRHFLKKKEYWDCFVKLKCFFNKQKKPLRDGFLQCVGAGKIISRFGSEFSDHSGSGSGSGSISDPNQIFLRTQNKSNILHIIQTCFELDCTVFTNFWSHKMYNLWQFVLFLP